MFICAYNRRLVETTGWKPRYELEEGLLETIHWWQKYLQEADTDKVCVPC